MNKNHDYNQPTEGSIDWHIPLNKNFEELDTDIEIRDLQGNINDYEPKAGAKYFATDTERVYLGDGSQWTRLRSTGRDPNFDSLRSKTTNGVVFAREFSGEGLASKVRNALKFLQKNSSGQGRVRVTQKNDGSPWIWDTDITINPTDWGGIEIDMDRNVQVEYPGNGWAITLDSDWASQRANFDFQSSITGGRWISTGNPTGWLRLKDTYKTHVSPTNVRFENASTDAVGLSVENHYGWSESTHVSDTRIYSDICVDFRPSSDTGGPGTNSFHGTTLENSKFEVKNVGVRARGSFDYSHIDHCSFFVKNDDVTLLQLGWDNTDVDPRYEGTVITACKFEDPASSTANSSAIQLGPNYDGFYGPTLIGGKMYVKDGQVVRNESENNGTITRLAQRNNGIEIHDLSSGSTLAFKTKDLWPGFALEIDAVEIDRYLNLQNNRLEGFKRYDNAVPDDLRPQEVAVDTNVDGTGATALLFKDESGTVHYWNTDGRL